MQRYIKNMRNTSISRINLLFSVYLFVYEFKSYQVIQYKYNDITQKFMDNTNVNQSQNRQRKDVSGSNNPMYGRKHSQQSREKMSQAATLRNQQYRDAMRNQHHITMDEFLSANPSVKEYIKILANKIIKEEINKVIWKQNQRIQIPNSW